MERTVQPDSQAHRQNSPPLPERRTRPRSDPAFRAARHASRAGSTYARFISAIASAGGYTAEDAGEYAVAVIATLEERLPLLDVCNLEAQLPSILHGVLEHEPILDLPLMDRRLFCFRVATRLGVSRDEAEAIATVVFSVLRERISAGEARRIERRLSPDLKDLWIGLHKHDGW